MIYKIVHCLVHFWFTVTNHGVRVHHRERLPEGAAVLCPNHTSLRDPLYVALACGIREKLHFMAKSELYESKPLAWFLSKLGAFPVRRGEPDIEAIRKSIGYLNDNCKLIIFPEGTRVTAGKDVEAKGGAAMLAARTGVPMVPVYIRNARTYFKRVDLTFGEPILVEKPRPAQKEAVTKVMNAIEEMKCQSK